MNLIRQKQIEGLLNDNSNLHIGSDVFNRQTTFTLGIPGVGEAHLDSDIANDVTTLYINVSDTLTENRYIVLKEYQQYDTLIIKTKTGEIAKYEIDSILPEVDPSNEGHFILTLQHSFGYSSTLNQEILCYYFRKSASDELIQNNAAAIALETSRATAAEASLQNQIIDNSATISLETSRATAVEASLQNQINNLAPNGYVQTMNLTDEFATKVNHSLGTNNIIVQVIDMGTGSQVTHQCVISNYSLNSIDIQTPSENIYKVLILTVGNFGSSPEPPVEEYIQTHVMDILGGDFATNSGNTENIRFNNFFTDGAPSYAVNNGFNFSPAPYNVTGDKYAVCTISWWQKLNFDPTVSNTYRGIFEFASQYNAVHIDYAHVGNTANLSLKLFSISRRWQIAGNGAEVDVNDENWHHYCLLIPDTTTNATARLFIDNTELTGSGGGTHQQGYPMNYLQIGTSYRSTESKFSNVQVFNSILSDTQVETLWNNGSPLTTTIANSNLKLWAKLDNDSILGFPGDWTIPDSSGNDNTGASSGMDDTNLIEEEI